MPIDRDQINRSDVATMALQAESLPSYDYDRETLQWDISRALIEVFPRTERYAYGNVAYDASQAATHLASLAAEYWREYVDTCERVQKIKRDYRNATHDAMARYQAMVDLSWAREYRDRVKACALRAVRDLMKVDTEAFLD